MNQVVIKNNDEELTYDLSYDRTELKDLIYEIIKDCSVRKRIRTYIETRKYNKDDILKDIYSTYDLNGNQVYENVDDLKFEPRGKCWEHCDPEPYSFISDRLMSPKLVDFLLGVFYGENIDYEWFSDRKELTEKEDLKMRMEKLDSQINKISNYDTERKIEELKNFGEILQQFNDYPDFDPELLSKYYDKAEKCINLELVQKVTYYKKTLTPPSGKKD